MERVRGESLKDIYLMDAADIISGNISMEAFKERFFNHIKATARCLYNVHRIETDQLETIEDRHKNEVRENLFLTQAEKVKVINIIDSLPKGHSVCHGDPNPNNIMVEDGIFRLIDWVNAAIGNPMYDIAEYVLISRPSPGALPENLQPEIVELYYSLIDSIVPVFLKEYEKISGIDTSGYDKWFIPLLVSKLNSNRPIEEKNIILKEVRERLS